MTEQPMPGILAADRYSITDSETQNSHRSGGSF